LAKPAKSDPLDLVGRPGGRPDVTLYQRAGSILHSIN